MKEILAALLCCDRETVTEQADNGGTEATYKLKFNSGRLVGTLIQAGVAAFVGAKVI